MKRFLGEFWYKFGWIFLITGVLIGASSAETVVDLVITFIVFTLFVVWVIMWARRERATAIAKGKKA